MSTAGSAADGGEALERSEELIEDARGAAQDALVHTDGDRDKEPYDAERFPQPGDSDDPAERF